MEIYKKIAAISTKDEYELVYLELEDRFGPIPDEVYSLLSLAQIRVICKKLNISSLKERGGIVRAEFARVAQISVEKVLRLITESGGKVRLDPQKQNIIIIQTGNIALREKSLFLSKLLINCS